MTQTERAATRSALLAKRAAFVAGLPTSARNLAFRVLPSPVMAQIKPGSRIALYRSMGSEAPTESLIEFLHERGFPLCLPRLGKTTADGFVGASSLERMGVEASLTNLTREFKRVPLPR